MLGVAAALVWMTLAQVDPAPPEVSILAPRPPSPPRPDPTVTVHRAPRPLAEGAVTHDWATFLGPHGNSHADESPLDKTWGADGPPLVWERPVGDGYAGPAVVGERVFLFHRVGDDEVVEALHALDGRPFWSFRYPTTYNDQFGYSDGPRCPPIASGRFVYTLGVQGWLHCLEATTGRVVWKRNPFDDFAAPIGFFGVGATPRLHDGRLITNVGGLPDGPTVAAFGAEDGRLRWGAGQQWRASYAAPIVADVAGRARVLAIGGGESRPPSGGMLVVDAESGDVTTEFPWRSRSYASVNGSPAVVDGDRVLMTASYRAGSAQLRIAEDGTHDVAWTSDEFGFHWGAGVLVDGHLYGFDGRNEPDASLVCVEWETGRVVWREVMAWDEALVWNGAERTFGTGYHRGQLVHVDDAFLALGEEGHLAWLELTPEGVTERTRAALFLARHTWSPLVVSRGLLYVRQNARDLEGKHGPRLLCYDLRGAEPSP